METFWARVCLGNQGQTHQIGAKLFWKINNSEITRSVEAKRYDLLVTRERVCLCCERCVAQRWVGCPDFLVLKMPRDLISQLVSFENQTRQPNQANRNRYILGIYWAIIIAAWNIWGHQSQSRTWRPTSRVWGPKTKRCMINYKLQRCTTCVQRCDELIITDPQVKRFWANVDRWPEVLRWAMTGVGRKFVAFAVGATGALGEFHSCHRSIFLILVHMVHSLESSYSISKNRISVN